VEELRFTYTADDLVAATRLHMMRSARGYALYLLLVLVVGAVFSTFGAWDFGLFLVALALGAFAAYHLVVLPLWARRRVRTVPAFQKEVVLRFDEEELYIASEAGESTCRWFYKVRADKKVLILYVNPQSYIVVPRRVCEDDAQLERIRHLGEKLARPKTSMQP
jgi:hypothetical protein